jgi:hypothetical protein
MKQECGVCGQEIETGGMGGAPMCEHYKWNHPIEFFGSREDTPHKYLRGKRGRRVATHPDPGEQSTIDAYA